MPQLQTLERSRRFVGILVLMLSGALPCFAQDTTTTLPTPPPVLRSHELLRKYVWTTLGPTGALHATVSSALEQWRDAPPEWGTHARGYAKRWGSEFAEGAIGNTTKYAVARMFHHDPTFTPCVCHGIVPRLRHALASPFEARTREGRLVLSPAIVAGLAAENIVPAVTWYPAPHGAWDGVRHAISGVVSKMAVDVFKEFRTRHRQPAPKGNSKD